MALLNEFNLWGRIGTEKAFDPRLQRTKGFDPEVILAQLVVNFTSGGASLADAERLDEDEALKALLGIEKFADQTTLGEWLREVGEPGWQALRRITRDFVGWALAKAQPGRYQQAGRVECFFDDTQIEVSGKQFEGAKLNYEGNVALSWQTLWVGPFLADSILGATSLTKESPSSEEAGKDVSACLPELIAGQCFQRWQISGGDRGGVGRVECDLQQVDQPPGEGGRSVAGLVLERGRENPMARRNRTPGPVCLD